MLVYYISWKGCKGEISEISLKPSKDSVVIKVFSKVFGYGDWRRWLARTSGGREVAGSSPASPTVFLYINYDYRYKQ